MDKECGAYQIQEINLAAGYGAEKIMQKIATSPLKEKLLLRNNKILEKGWYENNLVNFLEFFSPKDGLAETVKSLEDLFVQDIEVEEVQEESEEAQEGRDFQWEWKESLEEFGSQEELAEAQEGWGFQEDWQEAQEGQSLPEGLKEVPGGQSLPEGLGEAPGGQGSPEGLGEAPGGQSLPEGPEEAQEEYRVVLYKKQEEGWEEQRKNPRIYLKIIHPPYLVPFELELIPFEGGTIPLKENFLESDLFEEIISYPMFTAEEYLSRSFYKIVDNLELIHNMSWYKECYDILVEEVLEGKKVSQSFIKLLLENSIPDLSSRIEVIGSFKDYNYMEKRWENQGRRTEMEYPDWSQVIELVVRFFTPICEVVSRGEIFIGDWLPQFRRYLD